MIFIEFFCFIDREQYNTNEIMNKIGEMSRDSVILSCFEFFWSLNAYFNMIPRSLSTSNKDYLYYDFDKELFTKERSWIYKCLPIIVWLSSCMVSCEQTRCNLKRMLIKEIHSLLCFTSLIMLKKHVQFN